MKKILIVLLLLICLSSCKSEEINTQMETELLINANNSNNSEIKKIALVSDFHIQSEYLSDGVSYINTLNNEIVDATLSDIENNDYDLLILCGDNTNSGKLQQHQILLDKINKLNKDLNILVITGNHDIGEVNFDQFKELYSSYGYNNCLSKDVHSLSYSYEFNNLMIIVVDTNGYDDGATPFVKDETFTWLKEQLKYSKDLNKEVIVLGHYPLITRQTKQIEKKDEILVLLNEYNVPFYISGHLHYHAVNEFENLKEIVLSQTSSYPVKYLSIEINDDKYIVNNIHQYIVKLSFENKFNDDRLLNFEAYLNVQYRKKCDDVINSLIKDKEYEKEDVNNAKDFFYLVMKARSDGNLIDYKNDIYSHLGYKSFMEISTGSIWNSWIDRVVLEANEYTKGFEIIK